MAIKVPVWAWALFYVGALWLQLTVSSLFAAGAAAPDLLLVFTLALGFLRGPGTAASWGAVLGLSADVIAGRLIGLGGLSLAAAGLAAGLVAGRVFRENLIVLAATSFVLGLATAVVYGLGAKILGIGFNMWRAMIAVGLPAGVYGAILVPVVCRLGYRRLAMRFGVED